MSNLKKMMEQYCPNGVEYKNLEDVCDIKRGERVVKKQLNPDGLYPVISGGCTPMGRYDYYNREGNITTISQYGSAGFVDWQKSKFWANDVCYSLFAKDCVLDKFLYYTMKSKQDLLYELRSTDAIPYCLPIKILQSIEIPVPPIEVQNEVVFILDTLTEKHNQLIDSLKKEIELRELEYKLAGEKLLDFPKME